MAYDNNDIAIFTKLNDLAERRGLKPYDFVAEIRMGETDEDTKLVFSVPASGNAIREERFAKMLKDVGIAADSSTLTGSSEKIIDALDNALDISPKRRF